MLGAELAYDPKINLVTLHKFYNFALGYTAMQTFYDIVQSRSNIPLENDDLLFIYVLETKLALAMNTKVVPSDILNMFKVFLRFHTHLHIGYI